jgi:hypothetical protein
MFPIALNDDIWPTGQLLPTGRLQRSGGQKWILRRGSRRWFARVRATAVRAVSITTEARRSGWSTVSVDFEDGCAWASRETMKGRAPLCQSKLGREDREKARSKNPPEHMREFIRSLPAPVVECASTPRGMELRKMRAEAL